MVQNGFLLAKLTGKVSDDGLVQVEMQFGVKRYCVPVFSFPLLAQPYQEWIDEHKDKFLAIVGFEDGNMEKPLLFGMRPTKNNGVPAEGLDKKVYLLSTKFRVWLNDEDNEAVIDVLDGGKIKLGDKSVTEHGVLGDKLKKWLEDFSDEASSACEKAAQIQVVTAVGTSSVPTNAADFLAIKVNIEALKARLDEILSDETVFLK